MVDLSKFKGYTVKRKYDGVTECSIEGIENLMSFDFEESLNQSNPRNVFLNGQLYIEHLCDLILIFYFCPDGKGEKASSLWHFLNSRECDFSSKIKFLRLLRQDIPVTNLESPPKKFIEKNIITSLSAIAEVRNAFQHNLEYYQALCYVRKGGKFAFINKSLSGYRDVDSLILDFKEEIRKLNDELGKIIQEKGIHINHQNPQ